MDKKGQAITVTLLGGIIALVLGIAIIYFSSMGLSFLTGLAMIDNVLAIIIIIGSILDIIGGVALIFDKFELKNLILAGAIVGGVNIIAIFGWRLATDYVS